MLIDVFSAGPKNKLDFLFRLTSQTWIVQAIGESRLSFDWKTLGGWIAIDGGSCCTVWQEVFHMTFCSKNCVCCPGILYVENDKNIICDIGWLEDVRIGIRQSISW